LVEYLHAEGYIPVEIPQWLSLTVIVGIFVVSLVYARREAARHHVRHLEGITAKDALTFFPIPMLEWSDVLTIGLLVLLEGLLSADNRAGAGRSRARASEGSTEDSASLRHPRCVLLSRGRDLLAVYLIELSWVKARRRGVPSVPAVLAFLRWRRRHDRRAPKPAKTMLGLTAFWATVVKVE
jgi:hypothetical protein